MEMERSRWVRGRLELPFFLPSLVSSSSWWPGNSGHVQRISTRVWLTFMPVYKRQERSLHFWGSSHTMEPKSWLDSTPVHPRQALGMLAAQVRYHLCFKLVQDHPGPVVNSPPPSPSPVEYSQSLRVVSKTRGRSKLLWSHKRMKPPLCPTGSCLEGVETWTWSFPLIHIPSKQKEACWWGVHGLVCYPFLRSHVGSEFRVHCILFNVYLIVYIDYSDCLKLSAASQILFLGSLIFTDWYVVRGDRTLAGGREGPGFLG